MKNNFKQMWKYILPVLILMAAMLMPTVTGAAEEPNIPNKITLYATTPTLVRNWYLYGVKSSKDVTQLKSSNKAVASVTKNEDDGSVYVSVTAKKAGKATVSFTAKVNGKKKNYKCVVTVKKYALPFSTLKIGSTDMTKKLSKTSHIDITLKKTLKNQKLIYKLKKGWTLENLFYYNSKDASGLVNLKNGKYFTVKSGKQIWMYLTNKDGSFLILIIRYK